MFFCVIHLNMSNNNNKSKVVDRSQRQPYGSSSSSFYREGRIIEIMNNNNNNCCQVWVQVELEGMTVLYGHYNCFVIHHIAEKKYIPR